jgi:glyceraldehyde 3-phosphate dehydrogenase
VKVAINGFGRIGKAFLRSVLKDPSASKKIKVVAINIGPTANTEKMCEHVAHFFTYDSVLGKFDKKVSCSGKKLTIENHEIEILSEAYPSHLSWEKLDIDWIVEASGKFTSREKAAAHLEAGAKKVLITAPAKNEDVTIIPGVNDEAYDAKKHKIVSLGSCTTNCFAPIVKVIKNNFELSQGFMTTVHAYTSSQTLVDGAHTDWRRGRAAAINIVPTTTGADKVITKIYPDLEGKLLGSAIRVPVALGSIVEFTFTTKNGLTTDALNKAFEKASEGDLKNILFYETQPLVSSDFIGNPYSCIFDSLLTKANGTMGKVHGWYDNEFGYSCRLKDFLAGR